MMLAKHRRFGVDDLNRMALADARNDARVARKHAEAYRKDAEAARRAGKINEAEKAEAAANSLIEYASSLDVFLESHKDGGAHAAMLKLEPMS